MKIPNKEKLREIIENGGIPFKETSRSFLFTCPKCNKPKLAIQKEEGFWCCYKCKDDGFKGRPENIISILFNKKVDDVIKDLYPNDNRMKSQVFLDLKIINPWDDEVSPVSIDYIDLPEVDWDPRFVGPESPLFEPGRRYLIDQRGLTESHINKYSIKYNPSRHTVVFPVLHEGRIYGWQERGIDSNIKLTMKGLSRDKAIMFLDRLEGSPHAILTEGPVDALKCDILGGNVATMGKDVTDNQLEIIKSRVNRIYIALDPDAADTINRLCKKLSTDKEVYIMQPPKGRKDLGECTEAEVQQAFNDSYKYFGQNFIYLNRVGVWKK